MERERDREKVGTCTSGVVLVRKDGRVVATTKLRFGGTRGWIIRCEVGLERNIYPVAGKSAACARNQR